MGVHKIVVNLKVRLFQILVLYDCVVWASRMESSGTLLVNNTLLVLICRNPYYTMIWTRISNSLFLK